MDPSFVPQEGQAVQAKLQVNENSARENHRVVDAIHTSVAELARTAVGRPGVRLDGVDRMSDDISGPASEGGRL